MCRAKLFPIVGFLVLAWLSQSNAVGDDFAKILKAWAAVENVDGLSVTVREQRTLRFDDSDKTSYDKQFVVRWSNPDQILVETEVFKNENNAFNGTMVECRSEEASFVLTRTNRSGEYVVDGAINGLTSDKVNLFHTSFPYVFPAICFNDFAAHYTLTGDGLKVRCSENMQKEPRLEIVVDRRPTNDSASEIAIRSISLVLDPLHDFAIASYLINWSDGSTVSGENILEHLNGNVIAVSTSYLHSGTRDGVKFTDQLTRQFSEHQFGPIEKSFFTMEHYGISNKVFMDTSRNLFVLVNFVLFVLCVGVFSWRRFVKA